MVCEECGRNDAIVHSVQIGPDGRSEKHICMSHSACTAGKCIGGGLSQGNFRQ